MQKRTASSTTGLYMPGLKERAIEYIKIVKINIINNWVEYVCLLPMKWNIGTFGIAVAVIGKYSIVLMNFNFYM